MSLLVPPLVLLVGCDPCSGWTGPEFSDPDDLASARLLEDLARVHADFLAWTGTDRVCVREIEVKHVTGDGSALRGGSHIRVDPDAASPDTELRGNLCILLDAAEGITDDASGLFSSGDDFARACALGPSTFGWDANGCVGSAMTEVEAFLVERVYPYAPVVHAEASLSVALGEPTPVDGVGFMALEGAGDRIAVVRGTAGSDEPAGDALLVDPFTGEITSAFPLVEDSSYMLLGGSERAAVIERRTGSDDDRTMHVVDGATGTFTSTPTDFQHSSGWASVGDAALYSAEYRGSTLQSVDLATGAVSDVTLPAPEAPLQAYAERVVAVPGGALVTVYDAQTPSGWDPGVDSYAMHRYDAETREWEEQLRDVPFMPLGVTSEGLVIGIAGGEDEYIYAAWTLEAQELSVSDDVCVADVPPPSIFAADRGWLYEGVWDVPESLTFQAMEFRLPE